jgi:glucose-1-phosphate thymidylyltransferase
VEGIIILGGKGTRLNLFSRRVSNKAHAIVYKNLVFEYPINTLVKAGITDITIVAGYRYAGDLMNVIGDGKEFGITSLNYVYQKEAKGISDAINQARNIVKGKCAVILGDNFFEMDITEHVKQFEAQEKGCSLFCKKVHDPERYGVAEIENYSESLDQYTSHKINNIIEKPQNPISDLAVTGLYFYDNTLFDKINKLKPSSRGELEVTDLNMLYVEEQSAKAYTVSGYWNDMGTFDSILDTANFVRNSGFKLNFDIKAWAK